MSLLRMLSSVACVVLLACGSEPRGPKPPRLETVFSQLPLPPQPELVSQAGSEDALQLTVHSSADVSQVTEYYRNILSKGNWRLVSDSKDAKGAVVLYAEQDGPPMWVRIWKGDGAGTMVQLTGAVIAKDSAKSRVKRDTSSTRHKAKPS
jgi:hypothetical protein